MVNKSFFTTRRSSSIITSEAGQAGLTAMTVTAPLGTEAVAKVTGC